MKIIKQIITLTMPNVKDMEVIKKYGLITWLFVWVAKIAAILFIAWFCIIVLKFRGSWG